MPKKVMTPRESGSPASNEQETLPKMSDKTSAPKGLKQKIEAMPTIPDWCKAKFFVQLEKTYADIKKLKDIHKRMDHAGLTGDCDVCDWFDRVLKALDSEEEEGIE